MPEHPVNIDCGCEICRKHVYTALINLRNALTELSLALNDYQFEFDENRRRLCEREVSRLIHHASMDYSFKVPRERFGPTD